MPKIRVGLIGAGGRMGQEISRLLIHNKKFDASMAVVRTGDAPPFKAVAKDLSRLSRKGLDVVIDYSTPEILMSTIRRCVEQKIPLVTGITGLSKKEFQALDKASKKIPVFYSANMSLGLAALKAAMSVLKNLNGFDFQIIESHHRNKKDKPSGTALLLQSELERVTNAKWPEPLSYRVGGVIGEHELVAASSGEILRFSHEALKREIFAEGSLRAAEFLIRKPVGMYNMSDMFRDAD